MYKASIDFIGLVSVPCSALFWIFVLNVILWINKMTLRGRVGREKGPSGHTGPYRQSLPAVQGSVAQPWPHGTRSCLWHIAWGRAPLGSSEPLRLSPRVAAWVAQKCPKGHSPVPSQAGPLRCGIDSAGCQVAGLSCAGAELWFFYDKKDKSKCHSV